MGQRIAKHQYNEAGTTWEKSTYYVRDAQGNVLGTYEKTGIASLKVIERDLYGSGRIGMNTTQAEMILAAAPSTTDFKHEIAVKQFEISNHLGNVLAVITDRKTPIDDGDHDGNNDGYNENHASGGAADNIVDFYKAQIISSSDYSPFGVQLDGRNFSSTAYRYGFNGMEKDDEVKGAGNSYDYGERIYDSRLGRFLSIDPLCEQYPFYSSYQFAGNTPIQAIDKDGAEPEYKFSNVFWVTVDKMGNKLTEPVLHMDVEVIIRVKVINASSKVINLPDLVSELNFLPGYYGSAVSGVGVTKYNPITGSDMNYTDKNGNKKTGMPVHVQGSVKVTKIFSSATSVDQIEPSDNVAVIVDEIKEGVVELHGIATRYNRTTLISAKSPDLKHTITHETMHQVGLLDGYNKLDGSPFKPSGNLMLNNNSGYELDAEQLGRILAMAMNERAKKQHNKKEKDPEKKCQIQ